MELVSEDVWSKISGGISDVNFIFEGSATIVFNDACCDDTEVDLPGNNGGGGNHGRGDND